MARFRHHGIFPFFGGHVNMKGEKSGQIFTLKSPGRRMRYAFFVAFF